VLAAKAQGAELKALQTKVSTAISRAGVTLARRRFRPHVSIARLKRPQTPGDARKLGEFLALNATFKAPPAPVFSMSLMESILSEEGPVYDPLAVYAFTR
jgi:2'-5' RNA ligase